MQTVTILGAAGRSGDAVARAFLKAGWRVRGVARGAKVSTLAPGVEPVTADAFDREALIRACEGADVIVHALNPAYDKWTETVMPLAENVLAAAQATGATVMFPGNIYNFGTKVGFDTFETMPPSGDTEKARLRIAMEALFERAAAECGVQTIVIRAGDFFGGSRAESWLDLMILRDLKKDRFVWPGPWELPHAFAYLPDLAETFARVAEKLDQCAAFETFHFRGYAVSGARMHAAAERAVGRPLKRAGVPWPFLRLVGIFSPLLREVAKMSYLWRVPHSLANDKLEAFLGAEPHRPLPVALREAITDLALDGRRGKETAGSGAVPIP
ncbi:NAD-dependent epimerase/dehydratase family protein [Oricola cellulosilytica]|uniref:NAD-dependent epimerase/dehydratase family protein n=1 Tax=Oricola cellulosilytica TaxID=1429082 RepID=A0A4R0PCM8_9HYPH|nr:NAD-dependent epimerase/dehydratase family protein [Oricola cellulosilytica]TCD13844.1 NAD-dependent epimerase/dehydratase family protein [Oricola cellulosilytica]